MKTMIQAHRGASAYRPENTLEAFKLAIDQEADGLELDVHLTKDGHVVVAHDERLERVSNGSGLLNDYRLDELRALNFNKQFPDLPACSIPTLEEVYSLVKDTGLTVNVELKTTELLYPGLPDKLLRLEREHRMEGRILYSSFNHFSLLEIRKIDPEAKIGLLYQLGLVDPWVYARYVSADAIHPYYTIVALLPETVARCHDNGVMVNVWVVDDPVMINLMLKCGVDAIITDKPDLAVSCRNKMI